MISTQYDNLTSRINLPLVSDWNIKWFHICSGRDFGTTYRPILSKSFLVGLDVEVDGGKALLSLVHEVLSMRRNILTLCFG